MGIIKKIKDNYGYFKKGVIASIEADPRVKTERDEMKLRNKNIKEGNPEENLKLDKYVGKYHKTKGKSFWNKSTGGRMG